ncbi:GNAT family N-acetyltransferase [Ectothiorhodospiraceae bacterium BW-2]|nr:GNAT family N-acetyltransferase [Ectothiorhodospiraceae bacterium BW-2]
MGVAMDMVQKHYVMEPAHIDEQWDRFILRSPLVSGFFLSSYLKALSGVFHTYYCVKGREKVAVVLLAVSLDETQVIGHGTLIHDGILMGHLPNLNRAQIHSEYFDILTFFSTWLVSKYNQIKLKLLPQLQDIRPFQWCNYHIAAPKYSIEVRYTSIVDITSFTDNSILTESPLYQNASVSRKQQIRYGYRDQITVCESNDVAQFVDFYKLTMLRQNIAMSEADLMFLSSLAMSLLGSRIGHLFVAKDKMGSAGSYALFLIAGLRAYYLFGANNSQMRSSSTGTAVLWQAFSMLAKKGVTEVDLEGVNSPQRGWFKLSFGGSIQPYFWCSYSNSNSN